MALRVQTNPIFLSMVLRVQTNTIFHSLALRFKPTGRLLVNHANDKFLNCIAVRMFCYSAYLLLQ
jgi:hypothetical protein